MSRPILTQIRWATAETNYPAGSDAWSGQAVRFKPVADYSTPNTLLPAENFNWQLGTMSDDAATLLSYVGQIPAKNWLASVNPGFAALTPKAATWNVALGCWLAVAFGGSDSLWASLDRGQTWASVTITGGSTLACYSIAANIAGEYVIVNDASTHLYYNDGSFHNVTALAGTVKFPDVSYDETHTQWATIYNDTSGPKARVFRSANGTTWTEDSNGGSSTLPAAFTGALVQTTSKPKIGAGNGQFLIAFVDGSGGTSTLHVAVSTGGTSGGSTAWTGTTITTTITPDANGVCEPQWDDQNGLWVVSVWDSTNHKTEVWTSPNGTTWTVAKVLSTSALTMTTLAVMGSLYVGCDIAGYVVYSIDAGATWRFPGIKLAAPTNQCITAGGGGLLYLEHDGSGNNARSSVCAELDAAMLS